MGYKEELIQRLRREITLSDTVENSVQDAYRQIYEQSQKICIPYRKRKKTFAVVAVCAVLLLSTITVAAAAVYFTKNMEQKVDTVTYEFKIDYDLVPGEYEIEAAYIPDGYVQKDGGKTSYGNEDGTEYFTILPIINTVDLDNQKNMMKVDHVADVEHTTLSGMEADIITYQEKDKYEWPTNIYLFNPQEGYIVWVHGSYEMSVDELKKIADNLTVTRTGDSEENYLTEEQKEELKSKQIYAEQKIQEYRGKGILVEQIVPLGETFAYPAVGYNGTTEENLTGQPEITTFTIENVEVFERLTEIEPEKIFNYEDKVAPWLKEDGSLRSYTRQHYSKSGELLGEETVEQLFMKVKVKLKYEFDEDRAAKLPSEYDSSVGLNARLVRLGEKVGDHYEYSEDYYSPVPFEHNEIQSDGSAIGFNKPQYDSLDSRFFFRTMEDGEVLEYELLFVIDKDLMEENVVLEFDAAFNSGTIYSDTLNGSYFAIKK